MKTNSKGFTLVELLVAISILAILTAISIPTLRAFQAKNSKTQYTNYKKSLQTSGKLYNDSYSDDIFGAAPYGCEIIKLKELMNKKVAKDISLKDVSCNIDSNNSFVVMKKYNDEYSYASYLHCEDSNNVTSYDDMKSDFGICSNANKAPRVIVDFKNNTTNDTKGKSVVVTLKDEYGFTTNQSFEYVWTKATTVSAVDFSGAKLYSFNNPRMETTGGEVTLKSKSIMPSSNFTGEYRLAIRPKHIQNIVNLSNTEILLVGPFLLDHTAPKCPNITVTDQNGKNVAPNGSAKEINFKIDFSNKESDFKGYDVEVSTDAGAHFGPKSKDQTTDTYKPAADGKYVLRITTKDYAGNKGICTSKTYIKDTVPPNCPTVTATANNKTLKVNNDWVNTKSVNFSFKFTNDTTKWDWYTDSSTNDKTVDGIKFKKWSSGNSPTTKTVSITGQGKRSIMTIVYDAADNYKQCVSKYYNIDRCESTTATYGSWSACKKCNGGTRTRTITYKSKLSGKVCSTKKESGKCDTEACCSKTKRVPGNWSKWSACTGTCGTGSKTRTRKVKIVSTIDTSITCKTETETDKGTCKLATDCCSKVTYKDGTTCSAACGNGTYNRLAYSSYTGARCKAKDKSSGGAKCKIKECDKPFQPAQPTIDNKYNNKWTNKKYTFTMSTKSSASKIGAWYWKWDGGSWNKYSDSAGKNSLTSQKIDSQHDKKLYVKVCSTSASGVSDSDNCSKATSTTIKTDYTAPVMYTTNGKSKTFHYKPTKRPPVSSGVKIKSVTCHAMASNDSSYSKSICKEWSWKYTKVPPSGGEFWWGWDHIDCKDAGGSGCEKEYWKWEHDSSKSDEWHDWNVRTYRKSGKKKKEAYDKKFFAGTDRPKKKHGWAYAVDKAGNKSDTFQYYMTAKYDG